MDIQSAIGECDIARAILIAMGSYKKTPSPNESILQSLTFAVESSLDRAKNAFSHKKDDTTKPNFTPCGADLLTTDYTPYNIGNRIQIARENLGMSLDALATAVIPDDVEVVSEWENGKSEPCASEIIRLSQALKCDPMWLLTGESSNRQISADSGK
ncbi:helix-turn-helix domain-containing protein [Salmonella enterica subsp. enterica]|nr:helix-turn-helix domain-containing protein [Salmonella enterica subsp. enterica]ECI0980229.1 helix-turn-helix domain-containing protein [Salmonella enterica subsp. enterica serovar Newport]ECO0902289.1 helix-turn-helix domain-containing protein [Salmonella enterica subsp. enterica serovar Newport]ECO1010787.1 helix-turn-helix domain-containing protein [Salmonella enterica subsp. enterica serovar Newport]EDQ2990909.1 helix-turn-helix domain-containing protein [Salmonella enterica subsp. enter